MALSYFKIEFKLRQSNMSSVATSFTEIFSSPLIVDTTYGEKKKKWRQFVLFLHFSSSNYINE